MPHSLAHSLVIFSDFFKILDSLLGIKIELAEPCDNIFKPEQVRVTPNITEFPRDQRGLSEGFV